MLRFNHWLELNMTNVNMTVCCMLSLMKIASNDAELSYCIDLACGGFNTILCEEVCAPLF